MHSKDSHTMHSKVSSYIISPAHMHSKDHHTCTAKITSPARTCTAKITSPARTAKIANVQHNFVQDTQK
jgi:hypothetical protein